MKLFSLVLGALLVGLVPAAGAVGPPMPEIYYSCEAYAVAGACWGVDRAPDCPTGNSRSDWGVDGYVFGGVRFGAGGTRMCTTGAGGTNETKTMDAGVYRGDSAATYWSQEWRHTPVGSNETATTCESELGLRLVSGPGQTFVMPCVRPPPHPSDPLLP